ncbi:MAG: winged helix-turn-helix transcriptional regulator [Candidatus Methanofastidiosia archaeon]
MAKVKLDKTDLEILRMLQKNARVSISEISQKVNISRPSVKSRIQNLEKMGVIKKFTVILDKSAIVENIALFLIIRSQNPEILRKLLNFEEIQELHQLLGRKNILLKALVKNISEIQNLTSKLNSLGIYDFEYYIVVDTPKSEYDQEVGPEIGVSLECEYCGSQITGEVKRLKIHMKDYYFCCPVCMRKFKKSYERLKKRT